VKYRAGAVVLTGYLRYIYRMLPRILKVAGRAFLCDGYPRYPYTETEPEFSVNANSELGNSYTVLEIGYAKRQRHLMQTREKRFTSG
jgi:hypothetical protein